MKKNIPNNYELLNFVKSLDVEIFRCSFFDNLLLFNATKHLLKSYLYINSINTILCGDECELNLSHIVSEIDKNVEKYHKEFVNILELLNKNEEITIVSPISYMTLERLVSLGFEYEIDNETTVIRRLFKVNNL